MWISRKKYNSWVDNFKKLENAFKTLQSKYEDLEHDYQVLCVKMEEAQKVENAECRENDTMSKYFISLINNGISKTQICNDIGITIKTLDRIIIGLPIKPATLKKVREYISKTTI